MSLLRLLQKKRITVMGLNSGTSADGLDLAVVATDRSRRGYRTRFLAGKTRRYPAELRELVLGLGDSESASPDDMIGLDQALGIFYGRTAAAFLRRLRKQAVKVDAIASHGQTVRHRPQLTRTAGFRVRGSLQLGNLDQIAALTRLPVVGDFRQADIAAGGEGAPITTAAMQRLFGTAETSHLIVNIGGIANFFYFPARSSGALSPVAADCGPGNSLSDAICQKLFGIAYDRGGRLASKGLISQRLLALLRREPFFDAVAVSTGREAFGPDLADRLIGRGCKMGLSKTDLLATAGELTVVAIVESVRTFVERDRRLRKLYLTGGGVHNKFFTRRLRERLTPLEVRSITGLGFNPDLVEAAAFAVMGEACLRSEGSPIPGRIAQPPQER